ncbi:lysophospholipid acyltransferase family protein [Vibrio sp. WJH972]
MIASPFRLPRVTPFGLGESVVEWATGLSKLDHLYQQRPETNTSFDFMRYTLDALNVDYAVNRGSTDSIPVEGAVVIVANHPLGAIEGVILADLVGQVRKDVKVLANQMLKRLPEISDLFIGVDVFGGEGAKRTNSNAIREANQHLADGGVLVIFPAGEVSTYPKGGSSLSDIEWRNSVAKFIKHSEATTVPIFINGKNSDLFYRAGHVHPLLRTAMLGRELLNKRSTEIKISIGDTIPFSELSTFDRDKDIVNYLRLNTYLMRPESDHFSMQGAPSYGTEVIDSVETSLLEQELVTLPSDAVLHEQTDFIVYYASTSQIPNIMREIGRIRENSFRAVGEGSGLECDIDEFDSYYLQLFVWHKQDKQIVGSYRLCMVDELVKEKGIEGLYSRSLFNYDQTFIDSLDHSIEVGRSVVAERYQKNLNSLLMLWKGLASFASRNPKYTHLFGPVSISNDYSDSARQLMAATLSVHYYDDEKAELVKPLTPLRASNSVFWQPNLLSALASVSLLSKVLSRMEQGKGLPVLLRQYIKMNGKLVCFNVDPAFHDTLDGLIVVDLREVPLKTLGRYMGREQAALYLESHKV